MRKLDFVLPGIGSTTKVAVIIFYVCIGLIAMLFNLYERFCNLLEGLILSKANPKYKQQVKIGKIVILYLLPILFIALSIGYELTLLLIIGFSISKLYNLGRRNSKKLFK
jgi:hypothetical protein